MAVNRCAAPGCGRFARRDQRYCGRHDAAMAVMTPAVDDLEVAPNEWAVEFQRRLATGDYRELFGAAMAELIEQAAAERGLTDEIGILRIVLARVLLEEHDPSQLAESVSRVAGVAIQAARAQRVIDGTAADSVSELLTTVLIELDAGRGG